MLAHAISHVSCKLVTAVLAKFWPGEFQLIVQDFVTAEFRYYETGSIKPRAIGGSKPRVATPEDAI